MNTEQKLIVALLGKKREDEIDSYLAQDIDWTIFVQTAMVHRVIPPVF